MNRRKELDQTNYDYVDNHKAPNYDNCSYLIISHLILNFSHLIFVIFLM